MRRRSLSSSVGNIWQEHPLDERWAIGHKSGKQLSLAARVIGQQERTRTDTANDLA
jgi:hypothetical protein